MTETSYYTTDEAAIVLEVSKYTLYQWSRFGGGPGGLKPIKPQWDLLWPKTEVDRLAANRRSVEKVRTGV